MDVSKPARWFRMYAEFATDPKIQMLSEVDQRRFVMCLCLRCCNGDETLQKREVAFQLRISDSEWAETSARLEALGIIDKHGTPVNWEKRQFASDLSTQRVYKHRAKVKRYSNGGETEMKRPRVETETETETEKTPQSPPRGTKKAKADDNGAFSVFWAAYPRKTAKPLAQRVFLKLNPDGDTFDRILAAVAKQSLSEQWRRDGGQYIPHPSTWLNQRRWEDSEPSLSLLRPKSEAERYAEIAEREKSNAAR